MTDQYLFRISPCSPEEAEENQVLPEKRQRLLSSDSGKDFKKRSYKTVMPESYDMSMVDSLTTICPMVSVLKVPQDAGDSHLIIASGH